MNCMYACEGCGEAFVTEEEAKKCCNEEQVYLVSECCQAPIVIGVKREYPLGGNIWGIDYEFNMCEKCESDLD